MFRVSGSIVDPLITVLSNTLTSSFWMPRATTSMLRLVRSFFLALSIDTTTDASRSSGAPPARRRLWLGFSARFAVVATGEHCYARCPVAGFRHATGAPSDSHGCLHARSLLYLQVPRFYMAHVQGAVWMINLEQLYHGDVV